LSGLFAHSFPISANSNPVERVILEKLPGALVQVGVGLVVPLLLFALSAEGALLLEDLA